MYQFYLPTSISDIIFCRFILISDRILLQNGFGHIRLTQYRLSQIVTSGLFPFPDSDWLTNRSGRFDQRSLSNSHQFIKCLGDVNFLFVNEKEPSVPSGDPDDVPVGESVGGDLSVLGEDNFDLEHEIRRVKVI